MYMVLAYILMFPIFVALGIYILWRVLKILFSLVRAFFNCVEDWVTGNMN